jgi:hypothetical protein
MHRIAMSQHIHPKEQYMKANVGSVDRVLRVLAGLGLIGATLSGVIGVWGWIGIVPLTTGLFRVCPAYMPFGFNTCGTAK